MDVLWDVIAIDQDLSTGLRQASNRGQYPVSFQTMCTSVATLML